MEQRKKSHKELPYTYLETLFVYHEIKQEIHVNPEIGYNAKPGVK